MKEKLKNKFLGINDLSDNKQQSLVILLIWIVFIGMVVLYIRRFDDTNNNNNNNNNNQKEVVFDNLETIFNRYEKYDYEITISDIEDNKTIFKGKVSEDGNIGSRVRNEETINYLVNDYSIINRDTNEEIENLYDNYLSMFFVPNNIFNYVKLLSGTDKVDGDIKKYNYEYVYDDKSIYIDIDTTKNLIDNIVIYYDDIKYNINYSI